MLNSRRSMHNSELCCPVKSFRLKTERSVLSKQKLQSFCNVKLQNRRCLTCRLFLFDLPRKISAIVRIWSVFAERSLLPTKNHYLRAAYERVHTEHKRWTVSAVLWMAFDRCPPATLANSFPPNLAHHRISFGLLVQWKSQSLTAHIHTIHTINGSY